MQQDRETWQTWSDVMSDLISVSEFCDANTYTPPKVQPSPAARKARSKPSVYDLDMPYEEAPPDDRPRRAGRGAPLIQGCGDQAPGGVPLFLHYQAAVAKEIQEVRNLDFSSNFIMTNLEQQQKSPQDNGEPHIMPDIRLVSSSSNPSSLETTPRVSPRPFLPDEQIKRNSETDLNNKKPPPLSEILKFNKGTKVKHGSVKSDKSIPNGVNWLAASIQEQTFDLHSAADFPPLRF